MLKLKLKKSERLNVKELRRVCRLRQYDVISTETYKVTLSCSDHGEWEDTQVRVLADTAECPGCGKSRPRGVQAFSKEEWVNVLKSVQPHIRYIGKASVIEGRTLLGYKCRRCDQKFKNSYKALIHPRFKCPECKYMIDGELKRESRIYIANLRASHKKVAKARDLRNELLDLKAAYALLKELGKVKYPPQIDIDEPASTSKAVEPKPVEVKPVEPKRAASKPAKVKKPKPVEQSVEVEEAPEPEVPRYVPEYKVPEAAPAVLEPDTLILDDDEDDDDDILDLEDDIVQDLSVKIVEEPRYEPQAEVESEELLLEDESLSDDEYADDGYYGGQEDKPRVRTVGVYRGRGSTGHAVLTKENNYGAELYGKLGREMAEMAAAINKEAYGSDKS